jgi:hypothetical protein
LTDRWKKNGNIWHAEGIHSTVYDVGSPWTSSRVRFSGAMQQFLLEAVGKQQLQQYQFSCLISAGVIRLFVVSVAGCDLYLVSCQTLLSDTGLSSSPPGCVQLVGSCALVRSSEDCSPCHAAMYCVSFGKLTLPQVVLSLM